MSNQEEPEVLDIGIRDKLGPEMYKVAKALSVVLGYESFEEYISHCLRRDVNMFIQGEDEIGEYFRDAYRHLVHQPKRGSEKQRKEEVLQR